MNSEIYSKSIDTCELQLTGFGDKLTHFGLIVYLMIFPLTICCLHLYDLIIGNPLIYQDSEIWFLLVPLVLAIIAYFIQKNRLKYKVVRTDLKPDTVRQIIIEVAKDLKWERGRFNTNSYISRTNPDFFSGSWGEQITILFNGEHIFINSICDLSKKSSVVSFGRNRRNENTLIDRLKRADQDSEKGYI